MSNIIEELIAYCRMDAKQFGKNKTYSTPDTVAKIKVGRNVYQYVVPYGDGYECDGGHHVEVLSQQEFDRRYSLTAGTNIA